MKINYIFEHYDYDSDTYYHESYSTYQELITGLCKYLERIDWNMEDSDFENLLETGFEGQYDHIEIWKKGGISA